MTTSVLVVDDQDLVREGLVALLDAQPDLLVVGEAPDGAQAVALASSLNPDVVMMDIRMPVMDGVTATERIISAGARSAVLILTTFDLDEHVYAALKAGASGFLLKDTPPEQLVQAVRLVAAGDALLAPSVTRRLINEFATRPIATVLPADLTERENEIVVRVARGLTNAQIGKELFLSEATVKTGLGKVMTKLGLSSRAQVVAAVYEAGLLLPDG